MLDRNKVSYHMKDLLKRDIHAVKETAAYLNEKLDTKRDRAHRIRPKRLMSRLIAANLVLEAARNVAVAKEVMDRTEGKVADKLQLDQRSISLHIDIAGDRHNTDTLPSQATDYIEAKEGALDMQSSDRLLGPVVEATPSTLKSNSQDGVGGVEVPVFIPAKRGSDVVLTGDTGEVG